MKLKLNTNNHINNIAKKKEIVKNTIAVVKSSLSICFRLEAIVNNSMHNYGFAGTKKKHNCICDSTCLNSNSKL